MKRLLAPVVRQSRPTSNGAASLTSVCRGFGMTATEAEIFQRCAKDESGICIDDLEVEAKSLGLACQQLVIPLDHLLLDRSDVPSIVLTRTDLGLLASVVLWQRLWGLVQVMDPQAGRRWVAGKNLIERLYLHSHAVDSEALSEWMRSPSFQKPLERRLEQLRIPDARTLVTNAVCEPGWRGIATLDAVVREVASGAEFSRQSGNRNRLAVLKKWKAGLLAPDAIPEAYWFARGGTNEAVRVYGPVILRIRPRA